MEFWLLRGLNYSNKLTFTLRQNRVASREVEKCVSKAVLNLLLGAF